MKQFFVLILILSLAFIPMEVQAKEVDIEINLFTIVDDLIALPFAILNIILGPSETTLPTAEDVSDPDPIMI